MPGTKAKFITPITAFVPLLALTTMFGAWLCIYYFALGFERDTCERYNEKQYEHVQGIARNTSEVLSLIQINLEYVASLPEVQGADGARALPQLAACYHRFEGRIADVARIDAEGRLLATYKTEMEQAGLSMRDYPSTKEVLRTQTAALAGPFITLQNTKAIALDVPVFHSDPTSGKKMFTGTVSCLIEIDKWIKTHVTPYDVQLGSFTWIINSDHQVVLHSNFELIGEPWEKIEEGSIVNPATKAADRSADREFLAMALSGKAGKTQARLGSLGDEYQLIAYAPLRVANAQWVVISNTPRKAVLKPFNENLRKFWMVAGLFCGLLVVIIAFVMQNEQRKFRVERELRQSLQQSEKKYRTLIESSNDGILLTSPDGFIKLVNRRFSEMVGYSEEELLGQNIRENMLPSQRQIIEREWQKRARNESSTYELELQTKNGEPITVIVSGSPVFSHNEHVGNLGVLTDITDKKRAEKEITRHNEELLAINAIAETANQSLILEEIFEATTHKIREVLKLDGCMISSLNENTREISVRASSGFSETFLNDPAIRSTPLGVGYAGKATEKGELIIVEDISTGESSEPLQREGIVSAAFIPIKARQSCYGIIGCASRTPRAFSEQDIRLLNTIGQTMGIAVDKARLYENERLRAMRLETIYKVSDKLTRLLDLDELLPALVKLIHDTFNYYNVNIFLADKQTGELVFTAGCGGYKTPEPVGVRIKPPEGIVGSCFYRGEPTLVNDVRREKNFIYTESLSETKSELSVPLIARGATIGVLDVQSSSVNAFDKEDVITLQVLAEQIGVAVENAQLYVRLKHSLEEVRKSQAFFAKIVLESPLSIFIADSDGTCFLVNQSALVLLGDNTPFDKVIGKYNLLRDPPFAASPVAEQIRAVLAGEVVQFTVDLPASNDGVVRRRHDTLTLRATMFPLMDESGKAANIVAMFENLTEKKQLEEALQQAQRMESIGTLAGGIAHDFNNILGGVLGYTSFIKTKMNKGDQFYRYIDIIETSARRAADLTQQLLAFARGGKYRVQMLDPNEVVKEAVQLIASAIDKNITVTLKLASSLPTVEGDASQIIQTIVNICINARDAMPLGGNLSICSSVAEITEWFMHTHPGAKLGRYVLLTFTDTGLGMTEEIRQRIFEPFFTTKKAQKGTGLGLAMAYGIIKNHGGYIDVESEPGRGTTFSIYLPISAKEAHKSAQPVTDQLKRGSETILVAEDEDIMRQLIIEMLDSDGYQVIPAENGREALEIYRQRAEEIDLVILDMVMPELGGAEAFRQLKQINPAVKVLLSSGYSQEGQAQQILNEGVLGFIQKPYAVNDLLNKIRFIIDRN